MAENNEYIKESKKRSDESRDDGFNSWLGDLEEKEQPEVCSVDTKDCEACGS